MTITILQRAQLFVVYFLLGVLWFVDDFVNYLKKSIISLGRLFLFLILIAYFLKAIPLVDTKNDFSNYLYVLSPQTPDVLGIATNLTVYPIKTSEISLPTITANAVYAKDIMNDVVLFEKNSQVAFAPASTTKLMTALIALDIYEPNSTLIVPKICTEVESQKSGFMAGESYTIIDLISSLLINSSGDAACTLALGKISYTDFVALMNKKASAIGMTSTKFTNPIGLDDIEGNHVSTAQDLYALGYESQKSSIIRSLVATKEKMITGSLTGNFNIYNTNGLLWSQIGTVGIKTGRTEAAGEVLVYEYLDPQNPNINLIIVVMGSQDRFSDTTKILNWILSSFKWQN